MYIPIDHNKQKHIYDNLDTITSKKINQYLDQKHQDGHLTEEMYKNAKNKVIPNIINWLNDKYINEISPSVKLGIERSIKEKRYEDLIYAFLDDITFGTAGIRGLAALTEEELKKFSKKGLGAEILKGPNTINDIVLLIKSAGVANYIANRNLEKIAIGYDSRIQGKAFAHLIAKTFLAKGLTVYLFDEASPFPELTFAVPYLKTDLGILISASHNDKRYNGYKITNNTGAQLSIDERNDIYNNFIKNASTDEIKLIEFDEAKKDQLIFLGGKSPLNGENYYGRELINIHDRHLNHIKQFLDIPLLEKFAPLVNVGYCAYHGSGRKTVPRLLRECNFTNVKIIKSLDRLDGMFPCFLLEQQPDPGDPIAAEIAVDEYKKEHTEKSFKDLDILIGTDPDADRAGIIIKIPKEMRQQYKEILSVSPNIKTPINRRGSDYSWMLLDADTAWTLLLWYLIEKRRKVNSGRIINSKNEFISLNHTTTDALVYLARKNGLGVVKTWVGIPVLANGTDRVWRKENITKELRDWKATHKIRSHPALYDVMDMEGKPRSINIGTFEESNGFSIFGGPPLKGERLGENGHVKDKDGTFASILLAELVAYAKSKETSIFNLINEKIYLDPDIGLFVTYYEPAPYWGQYEGPTGISRKINILEKVVEISKKIQKGESVIIAGKEVLSTEIYLTGKYDALHCWTNFPDEGIRFFFDKNRLNHLTIRPSGTSHCIRFHVQIKVKEITKQNLIQKKIENHKLASSMVAEIRRMIGAEE